MNLVLVGLNHHSAPIEVRERITCPEHTLFRALKAVRACPGVREAVLLSTCNRMEVYALVDAPGLDESAHILRRHVASFHNVAENEFAGHLYSKFEHEAVVHLMRVASGVDSLVVGEAQILGQVRTAHQAALEAGAAGTMLNTLFQQALSSGKRVRAETALGRGAFSVGHAAVDLARSIFGNLAQASVLILGAGKMSELTAKHLKASGVRFVAVANRTYDKAVAMAIRLGGEAINYDLFTEKLVTADIVIASTSAPHPIILQKTLIPILKRRRGKPLFLIDIAVPRDVDPGVNDLDNVFLYNIDDLEAVVAEEAQGRQSEVEKAEAIAADEAAKFLAWYRTREVTPVIVQLQERLEQIRQDDLSILRAKLGGISDREWQAIEAATRSMMKKVAREPILRLKRETADVPEESDADGRYDLLTAAREIFGLVSEKTTVLETTDDSLPAADAGVPAAKAEVGG